MGVADTSPPATEGEKEEVEMEHQYWTKGIEVEEHLNTCTGEDGIAGKRVGHPPDALFWHVCKVAMCQRTAMAATVDDWPFKAASSII